MGYRSLDEFTPLRKQKSPGKNRCLEKHQGHNEPDYEMEQSTWYHPCHAVPEP